VPYLNRLDRLLARAGLNATNARAGLTVILSGTADPSAGAGVAATVPALYLRANGTTTEIWLKTGAGNTAWTKQTSP